MRRKVCQAFISNFIYVYQRDIRYILHMAIKKDRIEITDDIRAQLKNIREQTGRGPNALFQWLGDAPDGLNAAQVHSWMNGKTATVHKPYLDFVLQHWPQIPRKIPLTDEMRDHLRAEFERTGLGAERIMALMPETPDSLNPAIIRTWLYQDYPMVEESHWDAVMGAYQKI